MSWIRSNKAFLISNWALKAQSEAWEVYPPSGPSWILWNSAMCESLGIKGERPPEYPTWRCVHSTTQLIATLSLWTQLLSRQEMPFNVKRNGRCCLEKVEDYFQEEENQSKRCQKHVFSWPHQNIEKCPVGNKSPCLKLRSGVVVQCIRWNWDSAQKLLKLPLIWLTNFAPSPLWHQLRFEKSEHTREGIIFCDAERGGWDGADGRSRAD